MIIDSSLMETPAFFSHESDPPAVCLPLSKSEAARVLVASFWSGDCLDCLVLPKADDTQCLLSALRRLRNLTDAGIAGEDTGDDTSFFLGEGAAGLRFFLPVAASLPGMMLRVDCGETLRRRPMDILLEALETFGANVRSHAGRPPFLVAGRRLRGGSIIMDASVSSQFISGLMLSAPMWEKGLSLRYAGGAGGSVVSRPYIALTADVMRRFGADVSVHEDGVAVAPGGYSPTGPVEIEADWSAASYYYEYVLTGGRPCLLRGLRPYGESLQGDSMCEKLMSQLGVVTRWNADGDALLSLSGPILAKAIEKGVEWNLSDFPDLVPALAVGCCVAGIPFRFQGVGHLKYKETDRLSALSAELCKLGFAVEAGDDAISWSGARTSMGTDVLIKTYSDHRMAMAFGAVMHMIEGLSIEEPQVVAKSYPDFWQHLSSLLPPSQKILPDSGPLPAQNCSED